MRHRARAVGAFDWPRTARASVGVLLIVAAACGAACGDTPTSAPEQHAERRPAGANAAQPAEAPSQQSERAGRDRHEGKVTSPGRARGSGEPGDRSRRDAAADRAGHEAGRPSAPAGHRPRSGPETAKQRVRASARELLTNPGGDRGSNAAKELGAGRLLDEGSDQPPVSLDDLCQEEPGCP